MVSFTCWNIRFNKHNKACLLPNYPMFIVASSHNEIGEAVVNDNKNQHA